ncbi:MAG: 23S rRNA (adenine(2030)-N(6))-methyltransferase RlmJ [Alphaproteobacteria bacterium]|nr:23S rRNA (adenine(2030)-N(6))-methyltransferase RlmJ [Alphaproteobacteria bacterium]MDE2110504.1 23S rRNA (adenine(2030)-N(6))-methyltransferase RlmJ [Alphaproteobacteria bacterium]MDE2493254.1 23S rRNA (adenine(2030)-N(6))-methyltransferase RlmJ [Alphaproteobacteria bacterium]
MNYHHAYHAGNFADVAKHLALVSVLLHLRKKDAPFAVVDTHAGRGVYDLTNAEAVRTKEAENGIARLAGLQGGPPALAVYLDLTRARDAYPGSPLIAAKLLRPQDRLVAVEKHPDDAAALTAALRPFRKARAETADGYGRLVALLPPPERRAAILIDPPYETETEFSDTARAVDGAIRRFATGIYLIWFPVKSSASADGFCGEVVAAGARKVLRLDVTLGVRSDERLTSAGLLIVNPPFGFEAEMREALAAVLPRIGDAQADVTWLCGGE